MGAKLNAVLGVIAFAFVSLFASHASAAGSFKLKTTSVSESGGQWHLFVTLELSRAPATAHVPMKFLFTKEMVFERALIDNHDGPVLNRTALSNQMPSIESVDVDFADGSGKIYKGTRFDFSLSRDHGYEAGEYKVQVRTSDGTDIGGAQHLSLNGDNPVVDRRSITFTANASGVKKIAAYGDAGGAPGTSDSDSPSTQSTDVAPSGSAAPFIPADAYNKTPEEEVKTRPAGCCGVAGSRGSDYGTSALAAFGLGLAILFGRRRRG
jgi:uncharacterized protein (TIGR03382 family)